jgi:uncharacterized protein with PQ loop repeat
MLGDVLSWTLGSISNLVWLLVFIPQIIQNKRNKSSEAVSFYLLLLWYIGDTLSCISVIYKQAPYVLLYIGLYHIIFDIIFIVQVIYYRLPYLDQYQILLNENTYKYDIMAYTRSILTMEETKWFIGYNIIFILSQSFLPFTPHLLMGDILIWVSTFIFLMSRLPQILLNYRRRSVEGLSFVTFINVIIANQLFLASVLIKLIDINNPDDKIDYVIKNIAWIVGPSGGIVFDIIIFTQFVKYG